MTIRRNLRKLALTLHVIASLGWIGAVLSFLVLAIAGMASPDIQLARASYLATDLTYRWAIIPLGLVSLITGLVSSLSTDWGLIRHYWVLVKLLMTVPATILMLVHAGAVRYAAGVAATLSSADLAGLRIRLVAYAGAALLVLLAATALSTYKPSGRTRYGTRRPQERAA